MIGVWVSCDALTSTDSAASANITIAVTGSGAVRRQASGTVISRAAGTTTASSPSTSVVKISHSTNAASRIATAASVARGCPRNASHASTTRLMCRA